MTPATKRKNNKQMLKNTTYLLFSRFKRYTKMFPTQYLIIEVPNTEMLIQVYSDPGMVRVGYKKPSEIFVATENKMLTFRNGFFFGEFTVVDKVIDDTAHACKIHNALSDLSDKLYVSVITETAFEVA